ncbi:hypothetical protein BS47DRAFT_1363810 [Hydnum rufescens UP504]|uniref:Uncharacterized protein n=1 Tax=Hydnum rufescens UP504 TaxID=1448309 RepID=A0A9P6DU97_9AGAM|nr:hypothetical protein BS47DRAFT_1363810 [Hydnum rufescens UP504]
MSTSGNSHPLSAWLIGYALISWPIMGFDGEGGEGVVFGNKHTASDNNPNNIRRNIKKYLQASFGLLALRGYNWIYEALIKLASLVLTIWCTASNIIKYGVHPPTSPIAGGVSQTLTSK